MKLGNLIKETETHIIILFLRLLSGGFSSRGRRGLSSNGGSNSESFRVGNEFLDLLRTGEGIIGSNRDSQQVLVTVDDRVRNGSQSRITNSERDGGNLTDSSQQVGNQLGFFNIENIGREERSSIVNLDNTHTISEGRDVQHVQENSFGRTDLGARLDKLDIRDNFNGTTSNLGGDTESLEERGLSWFHTSVTTGNDNISRSNGTSTSRSSNTVGDDLFTDILEVTVGENETNVTLNKVKKLLEFGTLTNHTLQGTTNHGVLTHKNNSFTTEGETDLMHLVGTDIVNVDNEDGLVGIQIVGELLEVKGLIFSLRHVDRLLFEELFKELQLFITTCMMDGCIVLDVLPWQMRRILLMANMPCA
ncbi:unnamed protein product [Mucor circinelloides]